MCNLFKDCKLVVEAKLQPRGTPRDFCALCSERSVDYKRDKRVLTVLYRSQWAVVVPSVIFFPVVNSQVKLWPRRSRGGGTRLGFFFFFFFVFCFVFLFVFCFVLFLVDVYHAGLRGRGKASDYLSLNVVLIGHCEMWGCKTVCMLNFCLLKKNTLCYYSSYYKYSIHNLVLMPIIWCFVICNGYY